MDNILCHLHHLWFAKPPSCSLFNIGITRRSKMKTLSAPNPGPPCSAEEQHLTIMGCGDSPISKVNHCDGWWRILSMNSMCWWSEPYCWFMMYQTWGMRQELGDCNTSQCRMSHPIVDLMRPSPSMHPEDQISLPSLVFHLSFCWTSFDLELVTGIVESVRLILSFPPHMPQHVTAFHTEGL